MRTHYPRTPHLPWSPGATPDDVRAGDLSGLPGLCGREVVVTEKLDGENTTLYADGLHARSLDSAHHPSRAWVKALQGRIGPGIPAGRRICGENLYARHSLPYDALDSWFYGFSVWDGDRCLDWDRTARFLTGLGVPVPRVLWRGVLDAPAERALRKLKLDTGRHEGYVVRSVAGFDRTAFAGHVAKWVRGGHVQTGTHWMFASVVENGLGPAAPLWAVRSGAEPDVPAVLAAAGVRPASSAEALPEAVIDAVADVAARLDVLGRSGDARLAGVLATALHGAHRGLLASRLAAALGLPLARRVADLVGLQGRLHLPFPDEDRRSGLAGMSAAADLGVLHAVAGAVAGSRADAEGDGACECVEWSALWAHEAGLLGEQPYGPLRSGLREALAGLGAPAADRCWAQARQAWAEGRVGGVEEAVAATWRWRDGDFPRLIQLVGPSGSGKSTFGRALAGVDAYVSLDDLRSARGARGDQRANAEVLREGLDRLDAALGAGGTVVWDATSLVAPQRALVGSVARRRDALVTQVVVLADEDALRRRGAARAHPVPAAVLDAQLRRFSPPYPGQAHRTWYVGTGGAVEDTAGGLHDGDAYGGDGPARPPPARPPPRRREA
ncbi:RNA ligase family protein [Streptomyces sp. NPDC051555]|uniref:RNA ligase family protein n=1 Tax=Streptomyces sp. NPDC051555 TaxID=3365657 RepID=UPI00379CB3E4